MSLTKIKVIDTYPFGQRDEIWYELTNSSRKILKLGNECAHCGTKAVTIERIKICNKRDSSKDYYATVIRCENGDTLTVDHIVPRSRGGTDSVKNLQILCDRCNKRKGNLTEEEFKELLAIRGKKTFRGFQ